MAKKTRSRSAGKGGLSGRMVQLNPWIPALPVKGAKGKRLLKIVLAIPLALAGGSASAQPAPMRTLHVPVELGRQALSLREFDEGVLSIKRELLRKYEDKILFAQGGGKKG
jgi:hypothetical protein